MTKNPRQSPQVDSLAVKSLLQEVRAYDRHLSKQKGFRHAFPDEIATDIISSKPFQRLRDISFLGAITYVRNWHGKDAEIVENRFDHSIGVARIAVKLSEIVGLSISVRKLAVASSLLHDIGHPPLSHSAEPAFEARFGLNHHSLTERLIRGEENLGRVIPRILHAHGVDVSSVLELLGGGNLVVPYKLFSGPFNLDTLEGISRCNAYLTDGVSESEPAPEFVLSAAVDHANEESSPVLDSFWRLKNRVYNTFIRSSMGIKADYIANEYFSKHRARLSRDILLHGESEIRKDHQKLFEQLYCFSQSSTQRHPPIPFVKRTFVVDPTFPSSLLERRYTQQQSNAVLHW